ncbi:uncharacterized protein RVIR1_09000 [Candidatus Rickettsiella viridis]|uniref:Calcium-dependent cell adhesion molecule N-terminal domain-containing protein n=1 Tax=Candidatus Rickettsiella viridis TaxID=676208 RepID=A0A2Z5UWR9_9COXI|nr:beta/gamma crystallin domain-containing protein [Candidatus Rickettsiella viridis]BBB15380.1 uncharacterized protein RVIR1_09000 [Candidatus Rickettsiella viridis]
MSSLKLFIKDSQAEVLTPIVRVRVSHQMVSCDSIVTRPQLVQEGQKSEIYIDNIELLSPCHQNITIPVKVGVGINFETLQTKTIFLIIRFTTKQSEKFKIVSPSDYRDAFILATYDEDDSNKVIFYTGVNYTGDAYRYKIGDSYDFYPGPYSGNPLNDKFKSVKVGRNCSLHAWEFGEYTCGSPTIERKGLFKIFTEDTPDMALGDGLSSFVVIHRH